MNRKTRIDAGSAVLWASAFVIAALIIIKAGDLPANQAHARMAVSSGDFTLVTAHSGKGDDEDPDEVLYVLDSRSETLLVYEIGDVRQADAVRLVDGGSLRNLFIKGGR